jgi:hypothetical protein
VYRSKHRIDGYVEHLSQPRQAGGVASVPVWWQDTDAPAPCLSREDGRSSRVCGSETKHVTPLSSGSSYADMPICAP